MVHLEPCLFLPLLSLDASAGWDDRHVTFFHLVDSISSIALRMLSSHYQFAKTATLGFQDLYGSIDPLNILPDAELYKVLTPNEKHTQNDKIFMVHIHSMNIKRFYSFVRRELSPSSLEESSHLPLWKWALIFPSNEYMGLLSLFFIFLVLPFSFIGFPYCFSWVSQCLQGFYIAFGSDKT